MRRGDEELGGGTCCDFMVCVSLGLRPYLYVRGGGIREQRQEFLL